ncbi:hypothetical protein PAHAL_5G443000 [Panicum hallii]|uniref:Uncharacterized protein n=1 Tax=Panicum hallii TaxID=206008 RepID=A0A2T8INA9_9POAL|nr:hypothetical protein PAHAL_5G443000 [Panicum hallii]
MMFHFVAVPSPIYTDDFMSTNGTCCSSKIRKYGSFSFLSSPLSLPNPILTTPSFLCLPVASLPLRIPPSPGSARAGGPVAQRGEVAGSRRATAGVGARERQQARDSRRAGGAVQACGGESTTAPSRASTGAGG